MQSSSQKIFTYAMAVWGLLDGGSVMARRMRAFAMANEMGRVGGSCFLQCVRGFVALYALMTWNTDEDGGPFLLSCRWRIDWVLCAPL